MHIGKETRAHENDQLRLNIKLIDENEPLLSPSNQVLAASATVAKIIEPNKNIIATVDGSAP